MWFFGSRVVRLAMRKIVETASGTAPPTALPAIDIVDDSTEEITNNKDHPSLAEISHLQVLTPVADRTGYELSISGPHKT